ncbi:MAG: penicillin-binding transpeptidase domain-containing protein [Anaerolineales bacterium]
MSSSSAPHSSNFDPRRLFVVYMVGLLILALILGRLLLLQITGGKDWAARAVDNYTNEISLPAARGIIYDRNGYVLAQNTASYNLTITPANLPDDEADIERIYRDVSAITGVPVGGPVTDESLNNAKNYGPCVPGPGIADLVALGESLAPYTPVEISCDISEDVARLVTERSVDWPGVGIEIQPIRDYPTGSLTADVIGFLGPIPASLEEELGARGFVANRDKIGYAGIEDSLQDVLAGQNGKRVVQVDVAGQELGNIQPPVAAVPGFNVELTIDTRLQAAAQAALISEIDYWNTYFARIRISSGIVVAMNPKTGEILAMVSYPTYENNRMARLIPSYYYNQLTQDPRHPLLNNVIQSEYPPGSTFKLSAATGALNEGVVTPNKVIYAPGQLELCEQFTPNEPCGPGNTRPFVDWITDVRPQGFGDIDFLHCIAFSSDVCFYKVGGGYGNEIPGTGLGIYRLDEYAHALGYGQASGIELPGESDGLIPSPQWKRINEGENWSTGDTYIATVGQGYVLATPLQVLMSGATIANNGKLMQPTIIKQITNGDGKVQTVWFSPSDFTVWIPHQTTNSAGTVRQDWMDLTDNIVANQLPTGSYQISPFVPNVKWDITTDPKINTYDGCGGSCGNPTGIYKIVSPQVVKEVQEGMRLVVTDPQGTLHPTFEGDNPLPVAVAGKTGSAEYCDDVALAENRCQFGEWPVHGWTIAYAPYDDPEIIIGAFMYNGGEGAVVAAPVVEKVMKAYFELKSIDLAQNGGG